VSVGFRARLVKAGMDGWLHGRLVGVAKRAGVIGHRRVVDSTGIADSVVTQDTVSLIRSALRRCLRLLDELAPEQAQACRAALARDDYDRAGKPEICWASAEERQLLINDLFTDACRVIIACAGFDDPVLVAEVKLLALVAAQDVEDDGAGGVRIASGVAPERVISTVDPDARHGHRSRRDRYDGYKLHVSVDVDSDLFVTGAATTATTADGPILADLLDDDPVAVAEVIGDTHYGSAQSRRELAEAGVELTAPAQPSPAPKGFFSKDDFHIDLEGGTVTCPAGQTATIPTVKARRRQARFGARICAGCPLRQRCSKRSGGRIIEINHDEELLIAARRARWTPEFRHRYRQRAQVERNNAQLKSRRAKLPWRGVRKANTWVKLRMAALNLDKLGRMALLAG
jgi:Transposase DDE domain